MCTYVYNMPHRETGDSHLKGFKVCFRVAVDAVAVTYGTAAGSREHNRHTLAIDSNYLTKVASKKIGDVLGIEHDN